MKVFLSWSGEVSKQVAAVLRDWLPNVIQAIEPWMSSHDIDKGSRWSSEVAKELDTSTAGIICIAPGNHEAAWLNFEAGALSRAFGKDRVCPYLFRVKAADLTGPLVQFQLSESNKEDTYRLLGSLNKGIEPKPLEESKLTHTFGKWWPELEGQLAAIAPSVPRSEPKRSIEDMLEEVLSIVRDQRRARDETIQQSFAEVREMISRMDTHWAIDQDRLLDWYKYFSSNVHEGEVSSVNLYRPVKSRRIPPPPKPAAVPTQSIGIRPDEPHKQ